MTRIKDYLVYFFKSTDKLLLLLCILTSAFGVISVFSATMHTMAEGAVISRDAIVMIIAVILGVIIALAFSLLDYDILCKTWYVWAALGIFLMVFVMLFGVAPSARQDAQSWIKLGPIYFQPSEIVKVFFIITFATHLSHVGSEINRVKNVALLGAHALFPFLLVYKSGDLGSAIVFIVIAATMLFVAGLDWKYIAGVVALVGAAIPLVWFHLNSFQRQRFIVIVNPEAYPNTAYQQNLGLSALYNGGIFGTGLFKGNYTQSGAVPVAESDMIFTVVAEELGIVGGVLALGLIAAVIFRCIHDGKTAIHGSAQYMCYGVAAMIGIQTFINIAMVLRIGPVIGITLPFFSAGGSSTLCLYVALGLVFSVYRSVYSQTRETSFRLIGVRSPFDESFHDELAYRNHQEDRSNTKTARTIEKQSARLEKLNPKREKPAKPKARKSSKVKQKPKKQEPVKHSKTYYQNHRNKPDSSKYDHFYKD